MDYIMFEYMKKIKANNTLHNLLKVSQQYGLVLNTLKDPTPAKKDSNVNVTIDKKSRSKTPPFLLLF